MHTEERRALREAVQAAGFERIMVTRDPGSGAYTEVFGLDRSGQHANWTDTVAISWGPKTPDPVEDINGDAALVLEYLMRMGNPVPEIQVVVYGSTMEKGYFADIVNRLRQRALIANAGTSDGKVGIEVEQKGIEAFKRWRTTVYEAVSDTDLMILRRARRMQHTTLADLKAYFVEVEAQSLADRVAWLSGNAGLLYAGGTLQEVTYALTPIGRGLLMDRA